jgi:PAS domain S-box-containing protein
MTSAAAPSPEPPDLVGRRATIADLEERLQAVRQSPTVQPEDLVEALEVAYQELAAADEQIRAHRRAVDRLVESDRSLRLQHERTIAILPVAVVVTDEHGVIRSANAAAAALAGMRGVGMQGRPIFGLFAPDDRPRLRQLVSDHSRGELRSVRRCTARLRPGGAGAVPVGVTALAQPPGAPPGEISWVLLGPADREPVDGALLPETLTSLAVLGRRRSSSPDVLHEAATLCADALGAAVTVALGHPLAPTALSSSCLLAQRCDGAQLAAGEGPSVAAYESGATVLADLDDRGDLDVAAEESAWPRLVGRLPAQGSTVVAVPLRTGEGVAGTFTAYRPGGAAPRVDTAELLAEMLGGVLHELELVAELASLRADMERALASRAVIDQAKGIVMAARGIDADAAWDHLVELSNVYQMKLRDLAASMVEQVARRS